jgi:uncharacterized membrane protein YeaQ/YmgE (transglycosylase-associated protein family)
MTLWGLAVETVAGLFGAYAAASVAHEHRFGFIGHSVTGLVGGALSGAFLQEAAITMVTGSGSLNPSTAAEVVVINILAGAVAGAILTLAVGFLLAARSGKSP